MSRLNVLGLIICLMLAGCGIQVRTPPAPMVPPKPASFADPVAARPNPTLPPVNTIAAQRRLADEVTSRRAYPFSG